MAEAQEWCATGRRKESSARVRIRAGSGQVMVNNRPLQDYFGRPALRMIVMQPLEAVAKQSNIDVRVNVCGGGLAGQAGAILHGIARALVEMDPELRAQLKKGRFLTRDARAVERKKYGRAGARKRFQFSKR